MAERFGIGVAVAVVGAVLAAPAVAVLGHWAVRWVEESQTSHPSLPPKLIGLKVKGGDVIEDGEDVRFEAVAEYDRGSSRAVTSEAKWQSSDSTVLLAREPGRFIAMNTGKVDVLATFGGIRASHATAVGSRLPASLVLSGETRLHVGETSRTIAAFKFRDASSRLADNVSWLSSAPSIVDIRADGTWHATQPGSATLRATALGLEAQLAVEVIPSEPAAAQVATETPPLPSNSGPPEPAAPVAAALRIGPTRFRIAAGTEILVRLAQEVRTSSLPEGAVVPARVARELWSGHQLLLANGAHAEVRIAGYRKPGRVSGKATLVLELNELVWASGARGHVVSEPLHLSASGAKRDILRVIGGAVLGAAAGGVAGGGRGAAKGAAVGAGAGAASNVATTGEHLVLRAGAPFLFRLREPVDLTEDR